MNSYFILVIYMFLYIIGFVTGYNVKSLKNNTKEYNHIANATESIKEHESLRIEKYKSIEDKNKKVICYGNSVHSFKKHFGDKQPTKELCDSLVENIAIKIAIQLQDDEIELNDTQKEALISLIYNLRGGYRAFFATNLYQHIRYGLNEKITTKNIVYEWMDINKVNGKTNKGLLNRRVKELKVYFKEHQDKEYAYKLIDKEYKKLCKRK